MGATSSIGPVSGINYGQLITGLTQDSQAQIDSLGTRITTLDSQNTAILGLSALLTGLKVSSASFSNSSIFRTAAATSNNPNVVNATAGIGTPVGNYNFNVQQLAASSQIATQGFADAFNNPLGITGNVTVQLGGGRLDDKAKLTSLNGGNGVARGSIRITDRSGASSLVDLSHAVNIQDVVDDINSTTGVNVAATLDGDHLVLTDNAAGAGNLAINNAGGTTTASDLGLTGASAGGVETGTSLTNLKATTSLDALNDGNGVRSTGSVPFDFSIAGAGGAVDVALNGAKTVGDVISKINAAGQSKGISAQISSDGHSFTINDSGGGPVTVAAENNSLAAYDLGILGTSATGSLAGDRVEGGLSGPLLRDLNGGNQGAGSTLPVPGTISINGETVDLSGARSLNDVIKTLNTNHQGVTAALDNSGTGITLSSNSTSFTVADGTGNLASFLKIAGTSAATATGSQIASSDLHLRYISNNTLLSTLNGGTGFKSGSIVLNDGAGGAKTLNLSGTTINTIGDVISAINNAGLAVKASVDKTGNGIQLTQTSGAGTASVSETGGGTTAASLGILGTFTSGSLDGSFQKTISIVASDKLSDIATKFNNANVGIAATIINDGSGATPFRLSLASRNSGFNGRIVLNGAAAGLTQTQLVAGQDAAVVYGGNANGTGGLLATSSTNTFTTLVSNLNLTLTGVGTTTVSVNTDTSKITTAVQGFVDSYNKVVNDLSSVTSFDSSNSANNGVLFGNSVAQQVQDALGLFVTKSYGGVGQYTNLSAVGITVGADGSLSLDTDQLNTALNTNPDDVKNLFTTNVAAITGGAQAITSTTQLSTLSFAAGSIQITDGNGATHLVDLTAAKTISDVIAAINTGSAGTVTASINSTSDGILLTKVGGAGTASVSEVGGGSTAFSLHLLGNLNGGTLNGQYPPIFPTTAKQGIGAALSALLSRFTDAQTGILFDSSNALLTQEQQLKDNQTSLATLLVNKRNQLSEQFANLEVAIAGFQSQGSALNSLSTSTSTTSK